MAGNQPISGKRERDAAVEAMAEEDMDLEAWLNREAGLAALQGACGTVSALRWLAPIFRSVEGQLARDQCPAAAVLAASA